MPIYRVVSDDVEYYAGDNTYDALDVLAEQRAINRTAGVYVFCEGVWPRTEFFGVQTVTVEVEGLGEIYRAHSGPIPDELIRDWRVRLVRGDVPEGAALPIIVRTTPVSGDVTCEPWEQYYWGCETEHLGCDRKALRILVEMMTDDDCDPVVLTPEQRAALLDVIG